MSLTIAHIVFKVVIPKEENNEKSEPNQLHVIHDYFGKHGASMKMEKSCELFSDQL